jgi:hypothetical protein
MFTFCAPRFRRGFTWVMGWSAVLARRLPRVRLPKDVDTQRRTREHQLTTMNAWVEMILSDQCNWCMLHKELLVKRCAANNNHYNYNKTTRKRHIRLSSFVARIIFIQRERTKREKQTEDCN